MSWVEHYLKEKYESEGYDVIHNGAPDLILLKDGKVEFVEAKSTSDKLQPNQARAFDLLRKHGLEARIEKVRGPDNIIQYIFSEERTAIMERCGMQNITLKELRDLITRAGQFPSLNSFTKTLRYFYDKEETRRYLSMLASRDSV